jgi:hypothetical protein
MSAAHPFEIGPVVPLTRLRRRLRSSSRDIHARLHRINRLYREDPRFSGAWPVVRFAGGGELVYFDQRFFVEVCSEVGMPIR